MKVGEDKSLVAESLKPEDGKSRAELLKVMADTKKKLDSLGRDLA